VLTYLRPRVSESTLSAVATALDVAATAVSPLDLHALVAAASPAVREAKFEKYLQVLVSRDYFKGLVEGSTEYAERLKRARESFLATSDKKADAHKERGNKLVQQGKYVVAVAVC